MSAPLFRVIFPNNQTMSSARLANSHQHSDMVHHASTGVSEFGMLNSRPTDAGSDIFDGRYSDGRTAISHHVKVAIAGDQLVISGSGPQLRWPLRGLEPAEHLSRTSKDVMLHEPGRKGGTLYVADPRFVDLLAARAPAVTAWSRRWMGWGTFFWLAGVIAAIAAMVYVTDFSPARSVANLMPRDTRAMLGKEVVRSMTGGRRVCTQPAGRAALDTLAKKLSEATGRPSSSFSVSVIDSEVMNAFAAPGEQIVILRKLLETADSADEVAGVLAHEMGHGLELHPESGIVRTVGLMAITEFMLGGSGGLANMGLYLTQLGYTRQAERQADAHAIAILKRSGIATQGMMDFFRRVAKMSGEDGGSRKSMGPAMDILRTHPRVAERMAVFESQPKYPATPALTAQEWQALRSICATTAESSPVPGRPASPKGKKPDAGRDI